MKTQMLIGVLLLAVATVVGCRQRDITTVVISVPDMKNDACAEIVLKAVSTDQNVPRSNLVASVADRTVTVTYDTMKRGLKNIEMAIATAGFSANGVPANKQAMAKLPPACRAETTAAP